MKIKTTYISLVMIAVMLVAGMPLGVQAAPSTERSLAVGSSAGSAITTYTFSFKPGTTNNIGSIKYEICDSPLPAVGCVNTGDSNGVSFTSNSASIQSQSGISGFTAGTGTPPAPTTNTFWITNGTPQNINTTTAVELTLQNVRNPSAVNKQFYARISTYANADGTGPVDFGAVAASTAQSITVTGNMPESLVFCVGTSGTDCTNMTGSAVDLGTFSPTATNKGTSLMSASTNAGFGYAITLTGATLTSGLNSIPAMGTQSLNSTGCAVSCTSTTGVGQFGSNVRLNNIVSAGGLFGADVTPTGAGYNGVGVGGYNTANSFRFFSGDTVANSTSTTSKAQLFTNSYLVNVGGDQAAGVYTATFTYICTATF